MKIMSEHHAKEIISLLLLLAPYVWECSDDKLGDLDKKRDVWIRIAIALVVSLFPWLLAGHTYWAALLLCGALHFFMFDYTIAFILSYNRIIPRVNPFSYLGTRSKIDNWAPWRNLNPWARFGIRVAVLAIALILYF